MGLEQHNDASSHWKRSVVLEQMNPNITPLESWIAHKIGCQDSQLTRDALEVYQLEKLRGTLGLVRPKSRFYQKRLDDAPHYVSSLRDLTHFPFTTAQDIREQGLQLLCVSQGEIQRVVTLDTSGTTGQPKRLYFTQEDQDKCSRSRAIAKG